MKRALIIAILLHFILLLAATYILVMHSGKKEQVWKRVLQAEKTAPTKKIRTAPPKKQFKKTPAFRPLRRERSIELIAVKRAVTSEFTVRLPEVSGTSFNPQVALVSIPEPKLGEERLESFFGREIGLRDITSRLESFGVQVLKPLGTAENPITRIIVNIIAVGCGNNNEIGVSYPERRTIATGLSGDRSANVEVPLGPYAVPPEEIIFYLTSPEIQFQMLFSNDSQQCRRRSEGANTFLYEWEDMPGREADGDFNDVVMTVIFIGAQGGMF